MKIGSAPSILLVEDDETNRRAGASILKKLGCTVTAARNGKEAVEVTSSNDFDLILMDIKMPLMDGIRATKEIRGRETGSGRRHTPIIAVTVLSSYENKKRCLEAGMDGFISKPLYLNNLKSVIECYIVKMREKEGVVEAPQSPSPYSVLNRGRVSGLVGDDSELARELYRIFAADYDEILAILQSAIIKRDWPSIVKCAHLLGNRVNIFSKGSVVELIEKVEDCGRNRRESGLDESFIKAKMLTDALYDDIERYLGEEEEKRVH